MRAVSRPPAAPVGLSEVVALPDVVTGPEQQLLIDWAQRQRHSGRLIQNPVDATSMSTPYLSASDRNRTAQTSAGARSEDDMVWVPDATTTFDPLPDAFWTIRRRVIAVLGIGGLADDPYKGSFLTSVASGGDVHTHKDARLTIDGVRVPLLRCNVLVRRPDVGGMPVIEGREFDIPERHAWAFHPTENVHSATPVAGDTDRLTLSFGFVADLGEQWQRPYEVSPDAPAHMLHGVRDQLGDQPMPKERRQVLATVLGSDSSFTVRATADALGLDPAMVWDAVRTTMQLGLVRAVPADRPWRGYTL